MPFVSKYTLDDIKKEIKLRHGEYRSGEYHRTDDRLEIECAKGHIFKIRIAKMLYRKHWCPTCARQRISAYRMNVRKIPFSFYKELIEKNGGICLSSDNINFRTIRDKIRFRCVCGKERTMYGSVLRQRGRCAVYCPKCNRLQKTRVLIKNVTKICIQKEGNLYTTEIDNCYSPIRIKCKYGHEWKTNYTYLITAKRWCPYCRSHKKENICRLYFERFLGKSFVKTRPDWLRGRNGYPLELDGYCKELRLAFEYQGEQHEQPIKHFGGKLKFEYLKQNDAHKLELCAAHGIELACIPSSIRYHELGRHILLFCKQRGLPIVNEDLTLPIESCDPRMEIFTRIKHAAENKNWKMLSTGWYGNGVKMELCCSKGHLFKRSPQDVESCINCPVCWGMTSRITRANKIKSETAVRRILKVIPIEGEICNRDISKLINRSPATVSEHVKRMVKNGMLIERRGLGKPKYETCKNRLPERQPYMRLRRQRHVYYRFSDTVQGRLLNGESLESIEGPKLG